MSPSKQNLFLFFEENEIEHIIDRKLVFLYANRCIIDEDAQFEICGVYELQHVTKPMMIYSDPLYKNNASQRTCKEANDRDSILEAFEKASLNETSAIDTHFIIGSSFYSLFKWHTSFNRRAKLLEWMSDELRYQAINVYVTLLAGFHNIPITNEINKMVYEGKWTFNWDSILHESLDPNLRCSVNDDFELSISLIQNGERLHQQQCLFLHPKMLPHQFKSHQRSLNHRRSEEIRSLAQSKKLFPLFPDSNPNVRYSHCVCVRTSLYLK